jgi:hypothetical protein
VSVTCNGQTTRPLASELNFVVVRITDQTPDVECAFVNEFVPSSRLTVTKIADGPAAARQGPAVVELTCDDGTDETLTVPRTVNEKSLPERVFQGSTECRVEETATGVAPDATVETAIVAIVDDEIIGGVDGRVVEFTLDPSDVVEIVVVNVYATSGDGGGGDGGDGGGDGGGGGGTAGGRIPDTGPYDVLALAQWSALLVLIGGFTLAMGRSGARWRWTA